jgi:hypothetical protein
MFVFSGVTCSSGFTRAQEVDERRGDRLFRDFQSLKP